MSEEVIGRTFIRFYNKLRQNENALLKDNDENRITELGKYSGKYASSELLFCGVCGSPFRRKTWTRNGVKKIYWRCLYHMTPASSQKELKNTYYTLLYAEGLQKAFRVKTTCETRLKRCLPIPCRTIGCCLNTSRLKI